jgi:hypothetical protein
MGDPSVALAVASEVDDVEPGEAPGRDERRAKARPDLARLRILKAREGVGAGAGEDAETHAPGS